MQIEKLSIGIDDVPSKTHKFNKRIGVWIIWMTFQLTSVIILLNIFDRLKLSKHPILIVLSFDGFRSDYLNKTHTPNLNFVRENGVWTPFMKNQFATFTFPNHHSLTTGLYIESHGIVGNYFYDPSYGHVLQGADDDPRFWNYSSHVLPLYALNEIAGDERVSGAMMWAGSSQPYGEKNILSTHLQKFDPSFPYKSRINDIISWITNPQKPANLIFAYFPEPDQTAHRCGPESIEVIEQIQIMDQVTGYLISKLQSLGILHRINLMITSDHGMQEVRQDDPGKFIDLDLIINNTNNQVYVNFGLTPVLQILPNRLSETKQIYRRFEEASKNLNFTAYLKEEMEFLKPNWHYSNSRRIMPILLVADPGFTFTKEIITPERICAKPGGLGHHGFDNEEPSMYPIFMAMGPLFKGGGVEEKPFQNIDIYPLVSHVMGLPKHPNNGSFSQICSILLDSRGCPSSDWII